MHNDAEAQEIHGTVVSSGPFAEPAAEDRAELSEAADHDVVIDPDDQSGRAGEADDVTDPGDPAAPADRWDDDEAIDPDAVIIDETPARDETSPPSAVAGFARTPVAADDAAVADADAGARNAAVADADATGAGTTPEADARPGTTAGTPGTAAGTPRTAAGTPRTAAGTPRTAAGTPGAAAGTPAAARPGPAIPEAARPGLPRDGDGPATSGLSGATEQLHERWSAIQSSFVDDPRASVAAAAALVNQAIATLVASAQERERGLRGEWDRDGVDTEGLRNALRNYRGLLDHLAAL